MSARNPIPCMCVQHRSRAPCPFRSRLNTTAWQPQGRQTSAQAAPASLPNWSQATTEHVVEANRVEAPASKRGPAFAPHVVEASPSWGSAGPHRVEPPSPAQSRLKPLKLWATGCQSRPKLSRSSPHPPPSRLRWKPPQVWPSPAQVGAAQFGGRTRPAAWSKQTRQVATRPTSVEATPKLAEAA